MEACPKRLSCHCSLLRHPSTEQLFLINPFACLACTQKVQHQHFRSHSSGMGTDSRVIFQVNDRKTVASNAISRKGASQLECVEAQHRGLKVAKNSSSLPLSCGVIKNVFYLFPQFWFLIQSFKNPWSPGGRGPAVEC